MGFNLGEQIEKLESAIQSIQPEDTMAEAGRKALLGQLANMLKHETASRAGTDPEDIHQMRVAIRRTRSGLRLLHPYLKKRVIRHYNRELQHLARVLGKARDLDVLLENKRAFQATLPSERQANIQNSIDYLEQQRAKAQVMLNEQLGSKAHRRFIKAWAEFLTTPEEGLKRTHDNGVQPLQVRHVLPTIIYQQLAHALAYENALKDADAPTFHALRIEFKHLRYTITLFQEVLGTQIEDFIQELKIIQDCLGEMNDIHTARLHLRDMDDEYISDELNHYLAHLDEQESALKGQFGEIWGRFNTRRVQQKLAMAVLALR